jgi:PAS domain S-box-containing protein
MTIHSSGQNVTQGIDASSADERLRFALDASGLALWEWDLRDNAMSYDDRWLSMLGYQRSEIDHTYSAWESLLHPDDAERVLDQLRELCAGVHETAEVQTRLRTAGGVWKWYLLRAFVAERGDDARTIRVAGSQFDIHSVLETQTTLAGELARLKRAELNRHAELRALRVGALSHAAKIDTTARERLESGSDAEAWASVVAHVDAMRRALDPDADDAPAVVAEAPAAAAPARTLGRVLLADDCVDQRRLLCAHLAKARCEVTIAENGLLAVEKVFAAQMAGEHFDLILTDIDMPQMSGLTAAKRMRELGVTCPIIALTVHDRTEDRNRILAAGCDDHLIKPVFRDALLAACDRWIARRRAA